MLDLRKSSHASDADLASGISELMVTVRCCVSCCAPLSCGCFTAETELAPQKGLITF